MRPQPIWPTKVAGANERKKKNGNQRMGAKVDAFMPQMTEFAPRGQHFSHITAAWRAEFSCFPPIQKNQFLNWFPTLPCLPRLGISF